MQTIHLHHPYQKYEIPKGEVVLALGFFDGVHLAHQHVIKRAKIEAEKRALPLAVMTFDLSPAVMFQHRHPNTVQYLTLFSEKEQIMANLGVDILYCVENTSAFCAQSPQTFVENYIVHLNAKVVVAGFDYTYGKKEIANMAKLPFYAKNRFEIIEVSEVIQSGTKVGSTGIKQAIKEGEIALANTKLGYTYFISGRIVHGKKIGRTIGFPTANILVSPDKLIPKVGVYVVECMLNHEIYWGVASIGYNVTFGNKNDQTIEIYLFDFEQEVYGETLTVYWHDYLRGECKFNSVDELVAQMTQDAKQAKQYQRQYEPKV